MRLAASLRFLALLVVAGSAGCASVREVPIDPAVRQELGAGPPIQIVQGPPMPLGYYAPGFSQALREDFHGLPGVAAPALDLERAFLEALGAKLQLPNLQTSDRPAAAWDRDALRLDLATNYWNVDGRGLKRLVGRCSLQYGVTATLVQPPDGVVLWRAFHRGSRVRACGALLGDDLKLVKDLRPELASEAAAAFARSFLRGPAPSAGPPRDTAGPEVARPRRPPGPARATAPQRTSYTGWLPFPLVAWRTTGVRNGYFSAGLGLGHYGPKEDPRWLGVIAGLEGGEGAKARFAGIGWFAGEGIVGAQLRLSQLHTRQHARGVGPEVDYWGAEAIGILVGLNLSLTGYRRAGGPAAEPAWLFALGTGIGF